jgi:hypothetical protein
MSGSPCCYYSDGSLSPCPYDGEKLSFHGADSQKPFFIIAPGGNRQYGTAIKQGEGHAEKIYSTLS